MINKKNIKLVVSDVDGTLVPEGGSKLNPELFEIIRALKAEGIPFVAASGRDLPSLKSVFGPVEKDIIFMPNNGAQIVKNDKILFSALVPLDEIPNILAYMDRASNTETILASYNQAYTDSTSPKFIDWLENGYGLNLCKTKDLTQVVDDILKVSIFCEEDAVQFEAGAQKSFSGKLNVMVAGEHWIDFVSPLAGKGEAVGKLQEMMGISLDDTVAFGDNNNDITMLKQAKYSYAVATARPDVLKAASTILPLEENAVIHELKKLFEMNDQDV